MVYTLLIATLWQARAVAVARTTSTKPIVFSEVGLREGKVAVLDPEPTMIGGAVARVRSEDQRPRP
jgi:hypothetical protein